MKITVDEHLQSVLEFMQETVPTSKLVGVAEKLPDMARLLWSDFSQEPFSGIRLAGELTEVIHEQQSIAT
jgi:hypothetical protein